MTDARTFDQKLADPEWRAAAHRTSAHVDNLMRLRTREERRQYLDQLQRTEGEKARFDAEWHFGLRWAQKQEAAK